jgi:hypothetical protein
MARGLLLYFFWMCNKPNDRSRVIGERQVFIEPQGSIGDVFPEKTQQRTTAIRHRHFHPETIALASL